MADNENILRSYLVSIGYDLDEEGFRRYKATLQDVGKRTSELGEKMEKFGTIATAVAAELTASVLKISSQMDKLYFSSQRTGSSAKNMMALEYAAKQIGLSAEDARGALEAMAEALRTSPGVAGLLKSMNINPNEEGVQRLIDLVTQLKKLPYPVAAAFAKNFGIPEATFNQLYHHLDELKARMEEGRRLNPIDDEQVRKFNEFMSKVRQLESRFDGLKNAMGARFLPIGDKLLDFLNQTLDLLLQLNRETHGWSTALLGLTSAIVGTFGGLGALRGLLGALGIGGGGAAAGGGLGATVGTTGIVGGGLVVGAGYAGKRLDEKFTSAAERQRRDAAMAAQKGGWGWYDPLRRMLGLPDLTKTSQAPGGAAVDLHNPGNLRSWGNTPTVQVGKIGRFARFNSDMEGLSAMAGNLLAYSRRGVNTIQNIVSTWAPASDKNNVPAYIADVTKRMGVGANVGLNLRDPLVLESLMQAMIHHEQGKDPFNAKLIEQAIGTRLGPTDTKHGATVTIDQKTEIQVHSNDAKQAGDRVLRGQRDVNADMVRNMKGAVR